MQGYALRDMRTQPTARRVYTHYSIIEATFIDRFYATPNLYEKKVAADTVVATFTNNHSVTLKLDVDVSYSWRGKDLWKLCVDFIHDPPCAANLSREWKRWKQQQQYFPAAAMVLRILKRKLKQFYMRERAESRRDARIMEIHYYECIHAVCGTPKPRP